MHTEQTHAPLTVDKSVELLGRNAHARLGLAEERNNSLAGVTTNDGDGQLSRVALAGEAGNEGLSTDDIEGGDTEELLGVKDTGLLENFGGDGNRGVDRVGNDEDEGLGSVLGNALDKTLDNASVDLEEVVTGHARLAYAESVGVARIFFGDTYEEYRQG